MDVNVRSTGEKTLIFVLPLLGLGVANTVKFSLMKKNGTLRFSVVEFAIILPSYQPSKACVLSKVTFNLKNPV